MASCNIIRNDRGQVVYTEAPNGARSILFDSLVNKLQEPAEALKVWLVSKTKDFTEAVINPIKRRGKTSTDKISSPIRIQNSELTFEPRENPFTGKRTGELELKLVKTNPSDRGQGLAKKAIGKFLDYADSIGKPTYLTVSPREAGVSEDGLIKLYKSFGYVLEPTGFEMTRPVGKRSLPEVLEGMDENGEPKMEVLLNFIDNSSTNTSESFIPEPAELKNVMMGMRVKSTTELIEKLKQGFIPDGYFNPNRISLNSINLYNGEEITDILTSTDLQEKIRDFIYKLNNLEEEVLNDVYTDENFLVVKDGTKNGIGKFRLANPYIVEKQAVEVLGGLQTRAEFEDVLFNNESVSLLATPYLETQGTKDDLFNKFKAFKKIAIVSLEDGNLTAKLNNTREVLEQVLTEPENTQLEENLEYLINLDVEVYRYNPEAVTKLIGEVSKDMINIGLDTTTLKDIVPGKSVKEIKDFFSSVYTFITTETDQAFDNLIGAYNEFFEINDEFTYKNVPLADNIATDNSFYLESTESNVMLFSTNGLIPIGKNIYKRISKSTPLDQVYDRIYFNMVTNGYNSVLSDEALRPTGYDNDGTLNLSKVLNPENKEGIVRDMKRFIQAQVSEIYVGDEMISQEDLERYVLMFNYLNKSSDINKFTEKPVLANEYSVFLSDVNNQDYLQTDFIADFNKKALKEKAKDSLEYNEFYSNFEINNVGIKLVNQDPITMSVVGKYLEDNKNLVNYLKLHKQGINLDTRLEEDPIRDNLFMRNYYTNFPTALKAFKGDYTVLSKGTILTETKEPFIRTNEGLFELIAGVGSKGVFGRLIVQDGVFKVYNTALQPPVLDIDISELSAIDANLNTEVELSNLYSEEEKTKINNEHDNC